MIIVPGLIALAIVTGLGGEGDLQYNNAIPLLDQATCPRACSGSR